MVSFTQPFFIMTVMDKLRNPRTKGRKSPTTTQNYELSPVPSPSHAQLQSHSQSGASPLSSFLAEISTIQSLTVDLNAVIRDIDNLNRRMLNPLTPTAATFEESNLETSTNEAKRLTDEVKDRIAKLTASRDMSRYSQRDKETMKNQTGLVRKKFIETIQTYQSVEQDFRGKSRQRVERGYKIINPEATSEEVREFVNGDRQLQATMGAAYASSRSTLDDVQRRQTELKRMEQTLAELAQLFTDIGYMVNEQDNVFDHIETMAADVEKDAGKGVDETEKAVRSARAARKKKWILFWIVVIILIILAIVLAVTFGTRK